MKTNSRPASVRRASLASMAMASCWMCSSTMAATSASVTVNFRGEYRVPTCSVVGDQDQTVVLRTVQARDLVPVGTPKEETRFTITFQCPSGVNNARIFLDGSSVDTSTGNLVPQSGPGMAQNVQIHLQNDDGSAIKVGDATTMKVIPVSSTQPIPVDFYASYYPTGDVAPGDVNAIATYVIDVP